MQFTVQPGDTILPLNQMSNVTFYCTCDECDLGTPPFWTVEHDGTYFDTTAASDGMSLSQRGITYGSSGNSAVISIPNRIENNNTMVWCAAFISGLNQFSEPVKVTIIGRSITNCYKRNYIIVFQVPLYLLSQFQQ